MSVQKLIQFSPDDLVDSLIRYNEVILSNDCDRLEFTNPMLISVASKMVALNVHNVKTIMIRGAIIKDSAVKELCRLTWLDNVELSMCCLTNEAVKYISKSLHNLRLLDASSNRVIDDVSPLKSLKLLEYLNIEDTNVKRLDISWIKNTNLKSIVFNHACVKTEDQKAVSEYLKHKENLNGKPSSSNTSDLPQS